VEIDEVTAREVQAEQERYDAIVRALPRNSADWDAAAANHFNRLTGIYREFIRRRLREKREAAPTACESHSPASS
jgi:hypothetical protein